MVSCAYLVTIGQITKRHKLRLIKLMLLTVTCDMSQRVDRRTWRRSVFYKRAPAVQLGPSTNYVTCVAGELCKLARVTGPEFPHPFSPVGRCLPATGRCRAVRYKRQCLPGFCTMCWKVLTGQPLPPRVYMLKKCVALPFVIKRPVLQSAGTHV